MINSVFKIHVHLTLLKTTHASQLRRPKKPFHKGNLRDRYNFSLRSAGLDRAIPRSFVEFPSNSSKRMLEKGTASPSCPARICPSVKHMPVGRDTFANAVQFSVDIHRVSVPSLHAYTYSMYTHIVETLTRLACRGMIILVGNRSLI